jgi:hypothetical protein
LLNQVRVEPRLSLGAFTFLHFPKICVNSARLRQCLPQFVAPDNAHKLEAPKGISQKVEIGCVRATKYASVA